MENPTIFTSQPIDISKLIMADSVFTSFRSYQQQVPFLGEHLERLNLGCQHIFGQELDKDKILVALHQILQKLPFDQKIRITVLGSDFIIQNFPLTEIYPVKLMRAAQMKTEGLLTSYLKAGNYLQTNLELKRANRLGYNEIVFTDLRGNILECSTSNVFLIKNHQIHTPAVNNLFLNGITRQKIIKMLRMESYQVSEREIPFAELLQADEIFICNSVKGIRAVQVILERELPQQLTKEINSQFIRRICAGS